MTRRSFLACGATAFAARAPKRSALGVATTSYMTVRRFTDTIEFLDHCDKLGAAGVQTTLTSIEPEYLDRVKSRLQQTGMYIEVMAPLPQVDMTGFIAMVEAAKRVDAACLRSRCLSGRRYETFSTLSEWRKFVADSKAALSRAVTIADKLRLPLALENHKDWTLDEMLKLLKSYSSPYLGVCLDTGNNISLLDDPMEVVRKLAPYALSVHVKDVGVGLYRDGFLLSEVPIGDGFLNIPEIVAIVRKQRPSTRLLLEMITRDPLAVPVFTDKYRATFPERNGLYLARTMRMVHANHTKLPLLSVLPKAKQLDLEEANVQKCLAAMPG
ncbi:MAG TPA: sugar phosphate isomerase/epimerase family protein [Bryobacteraceae bacterium]|nr:sugar phosphate isomerase/epimerase family protein [Bryobacteraceae bacterium]